MSINDSVIAILKSLFNNPDYELDSNSALLGAIPEFDSMAVVSILTALEDQFSITVEDDEIDASIFETVGSLVAFVEGKLQAG